MRKGLLAEWRRGIVSRGLVTAALLAVPVGVAATIGFGTSLGGVSEGLASLASGPDRSQADPAAASDGIDSAIVALASPGGDAPAPAPAPDARRPGGGTDTGGEPPSEPTPQTVPSDPGGAAGDGGGPGVTIPDVDVPVGGGDGDEGGGDPVGNPVDGFGNLVNGILGGG